MTLLSRLLRTAKTALTLGGVVLALPISCSQSGSTMYSGGIQPSPASHINPFEPNIPEGSD